MRWTVLSFFVLPLFVIGGPLDVAEAEPPAPMADRVAILEIELRRGPAKDLAPYVAIDRHPLAQHQALRALGRVGTDDPDAVTMLASLLDKGHPILDTLLWAAGQAQSEDLAEPLARYLEDEDKRVVAQAAEALGWTGAKGMGERLSPLLASRHAEVRYGVLMGLARLGSEGHLERAIRFLADSDPRVRRAADFACWRLAGPGGVPRSRAMRPTTATPDWSRRSWSSWRHPIPSDAWPACARLPRSPEAPCARAVYGGDLRARGGSRPARRAGSRVAHPRAARGRGRRRVARHPGRPCRCQGAAIGRRGARRAWGDVPKIGLAKRFPVETDPRVKGEIAVELARLGDDSAWMTLAKDPDWYTAMPEPVFDLLRVEMLLASTRDEALVELLDWLDMGEGRAGRMAHAAVWMQAIDGLGAREHGRIAPWAVQQHAAWAAHVDQPGYCRLRAGRTHRQDGPRSACSRCSAPAGPTRCPSPRSPGSR